MSSMVGINKFFTRVLCPSLENQLFISQQAPLVMWTKRRAKGAMVAGTVAMALSSSGSDEFLAGSLCHQVSLCNEHPPGMPTHLPSCCTKPST